MMEPAGGEDVARRLDRLERASRHWKYTGIACMAVAIGSMAIMLVSSVRKSVGHEPVEAHGFVVKNPKGEILADFGIRANGHASLTFYGKDGKQHVIIGLESDNDSGVHFLGKGESRTSLVVRSDGQGGVDVYDQLGTLRTSFGLWKDNGTGMQVLDREGRYRASFGISPDESAAMNIFSKSAGIPPRASLGVRPDGTPMLLLRDASGASLFEEPSATKKGSQMGQGGKGVGNLDNLHDTKGDTTK